MLVPAASFAGVIISVNIAPPALPVYTQPLCPGEGYMWTPGYWAYSPDGYYWVPGVWVQPPAVGMLWTPGYWGWSGGAYLFHAGYWGPHIGFYGGVNYGFGYGGVGYEGGRWDRGVFAYNRSVNNINIVNVHNVYTKTVVVNNTYSRVSYNGGNGGIRAEEREEERAAAHERHFQPTVNQLNHEQNMRADRGQLASVNGGRPNTMAMGTVNERRANQQQRIANGVGSGQLTPGETRNLENREASINHQAAADRAANGGKLTPQEHQQINQRQNNVDRSIYSDKHNAATQNSGGGEIGQRQNNQQQRIANGINGQMNAGEAARAENRQQQINQQVHADREANGGRLTPQEHQQINREQNHASEQIHNEKHNDQRGPH
jgi:WXXGXW repeat (2 copies)